MRLPSFAIKWASKLPTTFGGVGWPAHMSPGVCDCKTSSQKGDRIQQGCRVPGGPGRIKLWQTSPDHDRYVHPGLSYQCD